MPQPLDPEAIAKAREAMRKKMQELPPEQEAPAPSPVEPKPHSVRSTTAPHPSQSPQPPPPAEAKARKKTSLATLPPMAGPALPISAEKQQQLQALLQRYKADQITPEQYQAERAKILGEQ